MKYDGIEVQYSALAEIERNLRDTAKQIVARLDALESDLKFFKDDGYQGVGKTEYMQSERDWNKAMDDMIKIIEGVAVGTAQASEAFRKSDERAGQRMSQIRA